MRMAASSHKAFYTEQLSHLSIAGLLLHLQSDTAQNFQSSCARQSSAGPVGMVGIEVALSLSSSETACLVGLFT